MFFFFDSAERKKVNELSWHHPKLRYEIIVQNGHEQVSVHYIFWRKTNFVFSFNFSDEEEDELEEASEDEAPPVVAKPTKKAMKKGKQKT